MGLGTLTDSLTAIRYHIFDKKHHTMKELMLAVDLDFAGSDILQKKLREETPKYGNDDDYADAQAVFVFNTFHDAVNNRPTARGGRFRINMLPTTSHIYFGSKTGATPEGRNAHQPFSEGISPCQGTDTKGPTAVLKSAAKIDHLKTGGTLLNQKFSPQFFRNRDNSIKLRYLIRGYFRMDGHHIQFNVVDANTLRDAQKHPEKHRDLIVRVAGYSDYFNNLGSDLQEEIIRRTAHEST
ncbi:MAG: glycine radical domain-containing protein [Bacteroidales bacterium]|nr:glycine radical domain-containing protein [Bacteroidales bacterium]